MFINGGKEHAIKLFSSLGLMNYMKEENNSLQGLSQSKGKMKLNW